MNVMILAKKTENIFHNTMQLDEQMLTASVIQAASAA